MPSVWGEQGKLVAGGSQGIGWGRFLLTCHQMWPQCSGSGPSYPGWGELGKRCLQKGADLERGNCSSAGSTLGCLKQTPNSCRQVTSPTLAHGP